MAEDGKNRVTVDIYGESYKIVGEESASYVRHVADMVDDKMREIKRSNPSLDTKRLAVLTSVNIVNDYLKLVERMDQLQENENMGKEEE